MKKSGTGIRGRQSALPAPRHLPLVDILVDAQAELQELVVASGLKVLAAMLEADRVAVCGPRYAHQPARRASRAGHAPSEVVLGGGVVARIVTGPHDANRQDPHRPRRYDTGRPRAVIRLRISQPRTASLPCPAGLRARRPSPMIDL